MSEPWNFNTESCLNGEEPSNRCCTTEDCICDPESDNCKDIGQNEWSKNYPKCSPHNLISPVIFKKDQIDKVDLVNTLTSNKLDNSFFQFQNLDTLLNTRFDQFDNYTPYPLQKDSEFSGVFNIINPLPKLVKYPLHGTVVDWSLTNFSFHYITEIQTKEELTNSNSLHRIENEGVPIDTGVIELQLELTHQDEVLILCFFLQPGETSNLFLFNLGEKSGALVDDGNFIQTTITDGLHSHRSINNPDISSHIYVDIVDTLSNNDSVRVQKDSQNIENATVKRLLDNNQARVSYENNNEATVNLHPSSRTPFIIPNTKNGRIIEKTSSNDYLVLIDGEKKTVRYNDIIWKHRHEDNNSHRNLDFSTSVSSVLETKLSDLITIDNFNYFTYTGRTSWPPCKKATFIVFETPIIFNRNDVSHYKNKRLFNNYKLKDIQTSDNLKKTQFLKYVITSKEQIMNSGDNSEVIETFENPSSEDTTDLSISKFTKNTDNKGGAGVCDDSGILHTFRSFLTKPHFLMLVKFILLLLSFFIAILMFSQSWNGYITIHKSLIYKGSKKPNFFFKNSWVLAIFFPIGSLFLLKNEETKKKWGKFVFIPITLIFYSIVFKKFGDLIGAIITCVGILMILIIQLLNML